RTRSEVPFLVDCRIASILKLPGDPLGPAHVGTREADEKVCAGQIWLAPLLWRHLSLYQLISKHLLGRRKIVPISDCHGRPNVTVPLQVRRAPSERVVVLRWPTFAVNRGIGQSGKVRASMKSSGRVGLE